MFVFEAVDIIISVPAFVVATDHTPPPPPAASVVNQAGCAIFNPAVPAVTLRSVPDVVVMVVAVPI